MKRVVSTIIGTMLLVMVLAPSSTREGAAAPLNVPKGKVVIGVQSLQSESPDPNGQIGGSDQLQLDLIYDRIVCTDMEGKQNPAFGVLSSWKMDNDGLSWVFQIHKGIKFHNGDPLTAEDVKFSFDRLAKSNSNQAPRLKLTFDSAEVIDPYTVRVRLKRPNARLMTGDLWSLWVVPKRYIERVGDEYFSQHPIGSGPYKFVSMKRGEYMEFEAFDDYWRGSPYVKTVRLEIVPELSTRLAKLKTGEIDIMTSVQPHMIPEIKATKGLRTMSAKETCKMQLQPGRWWSHLDTVWGAALSKVDVRQALNIAIDRRAIVQTLFLGEATPAAAFVDRGSYGADPTLKAYPYDPKKAKELLAKAGYPNGFEVNVYAANFPAISGIMETAEIVQRQWADIGVRMKIIQLDVGTLLKRLGTDQIDGFHIAGTTFSLDAWFLFSMHDVSTSPYTAYGDPAFDKKVAAAAAMLDPVKSDEAVKELDRYIYNNYVHIPIVYGNTIYGVNDRVAEWPLARGSGLPRDLNLLKLKD